MKGKLFFPAESGSFRLLFNLTSLGAFLETLIISIYSNLIYLHELKRSHSQALCMMDEIIYK